MGYSTLYTRVASRQARELVSKKNEFWNEGPIALGEII